MNRLLFLVAFLFISSSELYAQDQVKLRGHYSAIRLNGVKAFTHTQLRALLVGTREYMSLSAPDKPIADLEKYLANNVKAIYSRRGYQGTQVMTNLTPRLIEMTVFEGQKYKLGRQLIEGNVKLDDAAIQRRFHESFSWWRDGELQLDQRSQEKLLAVLEDSYERIGLYDGKYDIENRINEAQPGTMDMVVYIKEGRPYSLEKLKLNLPEGVDAKWINDVIGFKKGMAYSGAVKEGFVNSLKNTGRFASVQATEKRLDADHMQVDLTLLQNYSLPPIDEKYLKENARILEAVNWLNEMGTNDATFQIIHREKKGKVGIDLRVEQDRLLLHLKQGNLIDTIYLLNGQMLTCIDRINQKKGSVLLQPSQGSFGVTFSLLASKDGGNAKLKVGAGYVVDRKVPLFFDVKSEPFCFHHFIFQKESEGIRNDGTIFIKAEKSSLEVEIDAKGKMKLQISPIASDDMLTQLRVVPDNLNESFKKWELEASTYQVMKSQQVLNLFLRQMERLLSNLLVSQFAISQPIADFLSDCAIKLVRYTDLYSEGGWHELFGNLILETDIPTLLSLVRAMAVYAPIDSWLASALWNVPVMLSVQNQSHRYLSFLYLEAMIKRNRTGPLASWLLAKLVPHPQLRAYLCRIGIANSDAAAFASDIAPFMTVQKKDGLELKSGLHKKMISEGFITSEENLDAVLTKVSQFWNAQLEEATIKAMAELSPEKIIQ